MGISDFRALAFPADFTVLATRLIFYPHSVKRQKHPENTPPSLPLFAGANGTIS
jgi:hypothetical protein